MGDGSATGRSNNPLKEIFASDDPCSHNARNIGILAGAAVGAIIGKKVDRHSSQIVGAVLGGTLGGLIGADIDNRRCELSKIARAHGLEMTVEKIEVPSSEVPLGETQPGTKSSENAAIGLRVAIIDRGQQFLSGSSIPTPEATKYFGEIAERYVLKSAPGADQKAHQAIAQRNGALRILLVGHTDDTGSSQINADLSEQRAQAVAQIFKAKGIAASQLYFQGAGETLPIADNRSEDGRTRNRRVEIIDLSDEAAFNNYLAGRKPILAYYRPPAEATKPSTTSPDTTPGEPIPAVRQTPRKQEQAPANVSAQRPATAGTGLDFGGEPVGKNPHPIDIGNLTASKSFGLIPTAHAADDIPVGSCVQDRPRIANGVKSLDSSKEYATAAYLPGVYDSSWAGLVNGHLVSLTHVAVLRDGGAPARKPELLIYRDYQGDRNARPLHTEKPEVNAYRGDRALLYRVFGSGPVHCMDIVIPNSKPDTAPASILYYEWNRILRRAAYAPRLAK